MMKRKLFVEKKMMNEDHIDLGAMMMKKKMMMIMLLVLLLHQ